MQNSFSKENLSINNFEPDFTKLVQLPDISLNIASVSILIKGHYGAKPDLSLENKLKPFLDSSGKKPQLIIKPQRDPDEFINNPRHDSSISGETRNNIISFRGLLGNSDYEFGKISYGEIKYANSFNDLFGALRLGVAHHLIKNKLGVLFHASSAVLDNTGYIFPGESGTGKTTAILNSPGSILSDEVSALIFDSSNRVFLSGTPFGSRVIPDTLTGNNPVINFIVKDKFNSLENISKGDVLINLLKSAVFVPCNSTLNDNLMELLHYFSLNLSSNTVHATKDSGFWNLFNRSKDLNYEKII